MAVTKYADIITRIALTDRMVRMDLATVALESIGEDGQARLEVEERLCMPLSGFLRTYQEMGRLVETLKSRGVLGDPNSADAGAADAPAGDSAKSGDKSASKDSDSKKDSSKSKS